MNWKKDVAPAQIALVAIFLVLVAITLAYLAAGWKLRPANDLEVHTRKLGPGTKP